MELAPVVKFIGPSGVGLITLVSPGLRVKVFGVSFGHSRKDGARVPRTYWARCGGAGSTRPVKVWSDGPLTITTFTFLGITSSRAFVRAPEGNGCAERFIRTLKEQVPWVRTFATVEELRQALLGFKTR